MRVTNWTLHPLAACARGASVESVMPTLEHGRLFVRVIARRHFGEGERIRLDLDVDEVREMAEAIGVLP